MSTQSVFKSSLTASDAAAKDPLGSIRHEDDGKVYKYVKFVVAATAKDCVKYASAAGYIANEVGPIATLNLVVAGMAVTTHLINYYGWIQIKGLTGVLTKDITDTPVIADMLSSSATLGAFGEHTGEDQKCGVILNATTTTMQAVLDCPY